MAINDTLVELQAVVNAIRGSTPQWGAAGQVGAQGSRRGTGVRLG